MRRPARRTIYIFVIAAGLLLGGLIAMSTDSEYARTTDLGHGVSLVETVHVTRSPVTTIADSGGEATIPIPYRGEGVIHQKVLRRGVLLWESLPGKIYRTSVSPDGRYLVVWDHVHTEWWVVYDLASGSQLEVHLPVHPGMGDGMVPLHFGHWAEDSRSILVALDGEEIEPTRDRMFYREIYWLDPANGNFTRLQHCHGPYPPDEAPFTRPNWETTPCAGKFED
jgi:hypothetical protein